MADNYLTFSEVIAHLTTDEEQWLHKYLQPPRDEDFDSWTEEKQQAWLEEHGVDDFYDWPGFQYEICDRERVGRRLWLYTEESGNTETVTRVVQAFLKRFRPADCFALSYAITCSKMRVGEFGGGAIFVTTDSVEWIDSYDWVEEKQEEWKRMTNQQEGFADE